ncbi:unnamed protein product, partial [Didymodactylos carnosus]
IERQGMMYRGKKTVQPGGGNPQVGGQNTTKTRPMTRQQMVAFGYVFLDPFLDDDTRVIDAIVNSRKLEKAAAAQLDKAKKLDQTLVDGVKTLLETTSLSSSIPNTDGISQCMAMTTAQIVKDKKIFVDNDEVRTVLNKEVTGLTFDLNSLREETNRATKKFQTSIDAACVKINKDFKTCRTALTDENRQQYQQSIKTLMDQMKDLHKNLEAHNAKRLNGIGEDMKHDATR